MSFPTQISAWLYWNLSNRSAWEKASSCIFHKKKISILENNTSEQLRAAEIHRNLCDAGCYTDGCAIPNRSRIHEQNISVQGMMITFVLVIIK